MGDIEVTIDSEIIQQLVLGGVVPAAASPSSNRCARMSQLVLDEFESHAQINR